MFYTQEMPRQLGSVQKEPYKAVTGRSSLSGAYRQAETRAQQGSRVVFSSQVQTEQSALHDRKLHKAYVDGAYLNNATLFRINKSQIGKFRAQITASSASEVAHSYSSGKLFICDPLLINALMNLKPIIWSRSDESAKRLGIISPRLSNMIKRFDIDHLVTIPWQINSQTIGILRFAGSGEFVPFSEDMDINNAGQVLAVDDALINSVYAAYENNQWDDIEISLTRREQDILTLFSFGETIESVARFLGRSTNTVNTHTKNIFEKLSVNNRQHAVAKAHAFGLIDYSIAL